MNLDSMAKFPFDYNVNTRWKDMDSFGHVNNAVFLTYIEDARITLFKRWNLRDRKKSLIVASLKIDFLRPIKHPSELIIRQRISRVGNKSFDIQSIIYLQDANKPSASSVITCVCIDYDRNKTLPVYSEIKADYSE